MDLSELNNPTMLNWSEGAFYGEVARVPSCLSVQEGCEIFGDEVAKGTS